MWEYDGRRISLALGLRVDMVGVSLGNGPSFFPNAEPGELLHIARFVLTKRSQACESKRPKAFERSFESVRKTPNFPNINQAPWDY